MNNTINLVVKLIKGQSKTYKVNPNITVETFKGLIAQNEGYRQNEMRLIFGGKEMVDHNTLASYSVTNMGDVYVAFRWNGGGNQPSTATVASTPSTLSTAKSTASFGTVAVQSSVDKSHSCMVTQVNDSTTPRLKTPCGHYITSEGLDQWIDNAIFQNGARKRFPTEVPCPACQAGWSLAWVQSACTLSETDRNRMLARLSKNAIRDGNEFKECPLCETILEVKSAVSQSEPAKIFLPLLLTVFL